MQKNYQELIIEKLASKDWNEIEILAKEAAAETNNTSYFGFKKGCINLADINYINSYHKKDYELFIDTLKSMGEFEVHLFEYQKHLIKALKAGIITKELCDNKFVVVVYSKDTLVTKLQDLNFPYLEYKLDINHVWDKDTKKSEIVFRIRNVVKYQSIYEINPNTIKAVKRDIQMRKLLG